MKKNRIIIIVIVVVLLIVAIVGIIFGFGLEENFESKKLKVVGNVWYIELLECYENGVKTKKQDTFSTHPYVAVTKNQYVYCVLEIPDLLTEDNERICDYYSYDIDEEYIYVYGINEKNEEKYSYEVEEGEEFTWLYLTYGDEKNYCVGKYLMAM